jgi:uncharacterized membrane protein YciS (DUF1049 family)
MKQKGYVDINFGALFATLIGIGFLVGWIFSKIFDFVWPHIKSYIHTITG